MTETTLRHAEPGRDAAACAAIYAPHVEEGVTSFEERAPDSVEMEDRIRSLTAAHPWLVSEEEGRIAGFLVRSEFSEENVMRLAVGRRDLQEAEAVAS